MVLYVHRDHKDYSRRGAQDGHLDFTQHLSSGTNASEYAPFLCDTSMPDRDGFLFLFLSRLGLNVILAAN